MSKRVSTAQFLHKEYLCFLNKETNFKQFVLLIYREKSSVDSNIYVKWIKNVLVEGELFPLFFSTFFFDLLGLDFCFFPFNFDFLPSFDFCCNLVFFFNDFFFKLDFSFFEDLLLLSLLETLDSRFCLDDELILARLADEGSEKKCFVLK